MDFSLTEEQVLLQDSVGRYVTDHCDVDRHRRLAADPAGFDRAAWQQFAELGWLCVPFTEEQGGIGGTAVDVMVVSEALGRGLVREPYLSTVVTCGGFLRRASAAQQATYIPGIIDGSAQWAFAFAEAQAGYSLASVATTAELTDSGYRLSGEKIAVLNGHCADHLIVTARISGDVADADGIAVFIVDAKAPGVKVQPFTAMDGGKGAVVTFEGALIAGDALVGAAGEGLALVEAVIDDAILAMGAEALGAVQVLIDSTVEYTRTRE